MRRAPALAVPVLLTTALLSGCGAIDRAFDCANTAVAVAESVNDLQQAVDGAGENPEEARRALDRIDENLDKIDESSGDSEVGAAVGDLRTAVDNVRTSLEDGNAPDLAPVGDAADKLTGVCTPG